MTEEQDYMSPAQVARLAGVTTQTVRWWADNGRLPVARVAGGLRLFRRADVEHHISDREAQGRSAGRRRRG